MIRNDICTNVRVNQDLGQCGWKCTNLKHSVNEYSKASSYINLNYTALCYTGLADTQILLGPKTRLVKCFFDDLDLTEGSAYLSAFTVGL